MDSGPGLWSWAFALVVVAMPVTVLHELGHALAARWRLHGPVRVAIGAPALRVRFSALGIDFAVAPIASPIGQAGSCSYDGWPTAADTLVVALAGPAATAIGFVVALLALPPTKGAVHDLVWMAAMMQGVALVLCLVPFTLTPPGLPNDGKLALDALRRR
jgi:hypothetical protein